MAKGNIRRIEQQQTGAKNPTNNKYMYNKKNNKNMIIALIST